MSTTEAPLDHFYLSLAAFRQPLSPVAGGWSHNRTAFSFKDDNAGFRLSVDARRHLDCTQHVHLSLLLLRLGLAGPSKCKSIGRENLRREGTNQDVRYPLIVLPMRCSRPASPALYTAPPRALSWAVLAWYIVLSVVGLPPQPFKSSCLAFVLDLTTDNMPAAAVVAANLSDLLLETFWCRTEASRDTAAVMGENPKAALIASVKMSLTSAKSHLPLTSTSESTDTLVCSPHASTAKLPQGSGGSCRRMRVHCGAVDPTMLTIGSPSEVMEHVREVLEGMGIAIVVEDDFTVKCIRPRREYIGPGDSWQARPCREFDAGSDVMLAVTAAGSGSSSDTVTLASLVDTVYGTTHEDAGDEIRFSVELMRVDRLDGAYSLEVRRLKGNLRSYTFVYDTLRW